jgi:hypothetical protein
MKQPQTRKKTHIDFERAINLKMKTIPYICTLPPPESQEDQHHHHIIRLLSVSLKTQNPTTPNEARQKA